MSNKTTYKERYRPQFHYTPESMWMNDPNGLVYYEGEYHLFYQYHPESTVWGPMHWGHAISKDLVCWEQHPIALYPDHNGTIFSGSAIVDWKDSSGFFGGGSGLVAMFTQEDHYPDTGKSRQRQSLAYSSDKGRTWTMYAGNPVLIDERFPDYRDPKVFWDERRRRWSMVLAAGDRVVFYHSTNLLEWTYSGEFGATEGSHDGVWECPDLFELPIEGRTDESRWVLVVSIGANQDVTAGSRTQYFLGQYDGHSFTNDNGSDTVLWLDLGRDNYAGVTWSDIPSRDERRLFIGWMSNWKYATLTPTTEWRSAMTLPRALKLRNDSEGIRLYQEPVKELEGLRIPLLGIENVVVEPGGDNALDGLAGNAMEILAEIEAAGCAEFGFRVHGTADQTTVIGFDSSNSFLFIDRTLSGETAFNPDFACKHGTELQSVDGVIKLRIYLDHSSVEVFANDGQLVITDLVFPDPAYREMELYVRGGNLLIRSLLVYELKSIW